jgi:hypothetical protein
MRTRQVYCLFSASINGNVNWENLLKFQRQNDGQINHVLERISATSEVFFFIKKKLEQTTIFSSEID